MRGREREIMGHQLEQAGIFLIYFFAAIVPFFFQAIHPRASEYELVCFCLWEEEQARAEEDIYVVKTTVRRVISLGKG